MLEVPIYADVVAIMPDKTNSNNGLSLIRLHIFSNFLEVKVVLLRFWKKRLFQENCKMGICCRKRNCSGYPQKNPICLVSPTR